MISLEQAATFCLLGMLLAVIPAFLGGLVGAEQARLRHRAYYDLLMKQVDAAVAKELEKAEREIEARRLQFDEMVKEVPKWEDAHHP